MFEKQRANRAYNKLVSNGVIADFDALKASSDFDYTVRQEGATIVLTTNVPRKMYLAQNRPPKQNTLGLIGYPNGATFCSGDFLMLGFGIAKNSFNIKAREMKKGGHQKITDFIKLSQKGMAPVLMR